MLAVRSVVPDDFSRWLVPWTAYNEFYGRAGATALPPAVTRTTWERFFDADEPVYGIVAERNGELVALAHYLFHRSTISIAPSCYLQDLLPRKRAAAAAWGAR